MPVDHPFIDNILASLSTPFQQWTAEQEVVGLEDCP